MPKSGTTSVSKPAPDAIGCGEGPLWNSLGARWRQLSGDFFRFGFSFEWHDFETREDFDWARSFHPDSVEICLNLTGRAEVRLEDSVAQFGPMQAGFYRQSKEALKAIRFGGEPHQFITIELREDFLARHLAAFDTELHPLIRSAIAHRNRESGVVTPEPMNARQRELVASLRQPPVLASAQTLWFQAKALEIMGEWFFVPPNAAELFCHRQQRVARDRVEAVQAILKRRLVETPTLEAIAREVGCSPFYLSRTFSKETGQTIPQYVRQLRLERAAELLRTGRYNVTEVALEVGYNSLSHFSQAFHQAFGCCPGLYPMATTTQQRATSPEGPISTPPRL